MGTVTRDGLDREPNVIPMIDILLVLLIAAMLELLPMWKTEVVLPVPAESSEAGPVDAAIVLQVTSGPRYTVNGREIAAPRLIPELTKIYEGRPTKVLFIEADKKLRYQEVFWIFGAVRSAGVTVTAVKM
ncbi:MAG: ExbD/TolR family protein [Gemmatimonadaceae bacterium]